VRERRSKQKRDRQNTTSHSEFPTATGTNVRLAYEMARKRGIELGPLLARSGLTVAQIQEKDFRIAMTSQIAFLDIAAKALADHWLGFHLAQLPDLRELGMLYYVAASSENLDEALQRLSRYTSIASEGLSMRYLNHTAVRLKFAYIGVARHLDRHQMEFVVTVLIRLCRHLTGKYLVPTRVAIVHRSGSRDPADIAAFLGGSLRFGESVDELCFARKCKDLPLLRSDPYLNKLLVEQCERALAHQRVARGPFRIRVENAIAPLLPHGKVRMSQIASKLGLSQRTATRRLATEGVTFTEVLTLVRKELAARYLNDPNLTISQTAWLLGYGEVSAFSHAYKRWSGRTPGYVRSQYLRRRLAGAAKGQ
jgi:AraC-like DNA-binding protein